MKTNEETAVLTLLGRQAPQSFEELRPLRSERLAGVAGGGSFESRGRSGVEKIRSGLFRRIGARYEQD